MSTLAIPIQGWGNDPADAEPQPQHAKNPVHGLHTPFAAFLLDVLKGPLRDTGELGHLSGCQSHRSPHMADGLWEQPFRASEDGFDGLPTQIQLLGSGDALVAFLHGSSQVGTFLGTGENPGPQVMERVGIQAQALP